MELTDKELGYLELYKEKKDGIKRLNLNINEKLEDYYSIIFGYQNINRFMNFLATKNPQLMEKLNIDKFQKDFFENLLDMIYTISDIAGRYALENDQYHDELFRYENKENLKDYEEGYSTCSFKSTSTSDVESTVFNKPDTVPLVFKTEGFVPHINIDSIVDTNIFSDEKEVLFPPFIKGILTGEKEKHNLWEFYEVRIDDSFSLFDEEDAYTDYKQMFNSIKEDFTNEFNNCKKNKIVSEKLKTYCDITYKYLYRTIREMYMDYNAKYRLRKLDEKGITI